MRVGEVMHRDIHFLAADASAQEAAQLMGDLGLRALPVGAADDLQGILTDGDLLIRIIAQGRDARATRVGEIMSRSVVVCTVDDAAETVAEEMASRNIRRMPVIDGAKHVVGIVGLEELSPGGLRRGVRSATRPKRRENAAAASILVVEDEEDIRELLAAMLADDGHQCAEAGTCAAARALIEAQGFDLVITDVKLPDGTGTDIARAAQQANTRCLLITGDSNQMQRLEFREQEYLAKPFRASQLRERVRGLLPETRVAAQKPVPAEAGPSGAAAGRRRSPKWFPFRIA
ncbi:MAG: CBS domain-containing protein [Alphaproteobacteria bacterium]|nr:CBS domain-containing protein [Alphaproteobacteria bacterium]